MKTEYQDNFTVSALTNFYQPKGTSNALTNKQIDNPLRVPQPPVQPRQKEQTTSTLTNRIPKMTTEYQDKFLPPVNNNSIVTAPLVPDYRNLKETGNFLTNIQMGNPLWPPKPSLQPINSTYSNLSHVVEAQVLSKLDSKGLVVTNSDSKTDRSQESLKPLTSYRSDYCNHPVQPRWFETSREEHTRTMEGNFNLAPQNHALCQQMKTMEFPFRPSCVPPISKTNFVSKDATTQEEQAIMALMEMSDDKRRAMLEDISVDDFSFCRLYVMQERELKEKAGGHSIADELWAKLETDKLFWEEVKLKAQKKIEEHITRLEDKVHLAPLDVKSSKLSPISKTTILAKDAPMKLETSKQFVLDNQDAIMGLMEMTDEERRRAMLESISVDCFCIYTLYVMREKELREMAMFQSKADKLWANLEMADKESRTPILDPSTAHRLHTMREKELKEEAERRSKAAMLKVDMEADKSFWEEEELQIQKEREASTKVMKFNLNTVTHQHACRQQMTTGEVPINPFDLPYVSKTTVAAKDTFKKEANNHLPNSPQAPQHPKYGTWNVPACWPRKARSPIFKLLNARNNVEHMRRISPSSHNFSFTELRYV